VSVSIASHLRHEFAEESLHLFVFDELIGFVLDKFCVVRNLDNQCVLLVVVFKRATNLVWILKVNCFCCFLKLGPIFDKHLDKGVQLRNGNLLVESTFFETRRMRRAAADTGCQPSLVQISGPG